MHTCVQTAKNIYGHAEIFSLMGTELKTKIIVFSFTNTKIKRKYERGEWSTNTFWQIHDLLSLLTLPIQTACRILSGSSLYYIESRTHRQCLSDISKYAYCLCSIVRLSADTNCCLFAQQRQPWLQQLTAVTTATHACTDDLPVWSIGNLWISIHVCNICWRDC